jgi:O-antigen/teichoic acid export membrane protein
LQISKQCVIETRSADWLKPGVTQTTLKEIFAFSIYSWLQGVSGIILGQADKLLLGSFSGTTALGHYSICLQVTQTAHGLVARMFSYVFPKAATLVTNNERQQLTNVFHNGMIVSTTIGCGIAFALMLLEHDLFLLWMGPQFTSGIAPYFFILCIANALMSTSVVPFYVMNGSGHFRQNTVFSLMSGALVFAVSSFCIPLYGIKGAAIARIANLPISIASRILLSRNILNDNRWYAGLLHFVPVIAGLLVVLLIRTFSMSSPTARIPFHLVGVGISTYVCYFSAVLIYKRHLSRNSHAP